MSTEPATPIRTSGTIRDKDKFVTIAGIKITDKFMGEFHRQGLAREFDCRGSFQRHLTWAKGTAIPQPQLYAPGGR